VAHEGLGEARGLVRDDAPGHVSRLQTREQRRHLREDAGRRRHASLVAIEELFAQRGIAVVGRPDSERNRDHAARARADERSERLVEQRLEAARRAHFVACGGEVGGAVDQRAIEVEQHAEGAGTHRAGRARGGAITVMQASGTRRGS
jgi:hypothetical protein